MPGAQRTRTPTRCTPFHHGWERGAHDRAPPAWMRGRTVLAGGSRTSWALAAEGGMPASRIGGKSAHAEGRIPASGAGSPRYGQAAVSRTTQPWHPSRDAGRSDTERALRQGSRPRSGPSRSDPPASGDPHAPPGTRSWVRVGGPAAGPIGGRQRDHVPDRALTTPETRLLWRPVAQSGDQWGPVGTCITKGTAKWGVGGDAGAAGIHRTRRDEAERSTSTGVHR
jgi:hypothetical protein